MKLRNKKTGEIYIFGETQIVSPHRSGMNIFHMYNSLAELNEEWEDYEEPKWLRDYWFIDSCGSIIKQEDDVLGSTRREIGNYFETKEEAEKAVEKLKVFKQLKDKGFEFAGWDMRNGDGGYEPSIGFELNGVTDVLEKYEIAQEITQDLDFLFGGEDA